MKPKYDYDYQFTETLIADEWDLIRDIQDQDDFDMNIDLTSDAIHEVSGRYVDMPNTTRCEEEHEGGFYGKVRLTYIDDIYVCAEALIDYTRLRDEGLFTIELYYDEVEYEY